MLSMRKPWEKGAGASSQRQGSGPSPRPCSPLRVATGMTLQSRSPGTTPRAAAALDKGRLRMLQALPTDKAKLRLGFVTMRSRVHHPSKGCSLPTAAQSPPPQVPPLLCWFPSVCTAWLGALSCGGEAGGFWRQDHRTRCREGSGRLVPAGGAEQPPMGAWGELAPGSRPADREGPSDRLLLQELPSVDGAPPSSCQRKPPQMRRVDWRLPTLVPSLLHLRGENHRHTNSVRVPPAEPAPARPVLGLARVQ